MKRHFSSLCVAVGLGLVPALPAQSIFNFVFDGSGDSGINSALVGSGFVSLGVDPGLDGSYPLSALGPVTFSFTFPDAALVFTNADITTPLADLRLLFTTTGGERRLQFSNTRAIGRGPLSGSLDFGGFSRGLTFAPPGPGFTGALNQFMVLDASGSIFGNYYAAQTVSAVPEPGTWLAGGLAGAVVLVWRRRR